MKIFLITILTFWSLISSAQIVDEINNETLLDDNSFRTHFVIEDCNLSSLKPENQYKKIACINAKSPDNTSTDNTFLDIHSDAAIESIKPKSPNYEIWYKLSLFEIGIRYGSPNNSNSISNKIQYGQAIINFSLGLQRLGGLGLGTKLVVYYGMPDNVEIHSWVPIYSYFPVYISRKKTEPYIQDKNTYDIPFMINFYAGGSLWCTTSSSYRISEEAILSSKFYHIGVNCMFFNYTSKMSGFFNGNFSFDTGMIFYQNTGTAFKSIFNVGLIYNFVGIARITND